jgi:UTP--glucose-1-phosphate uridylyltransferase
MRAEGLPGLAIDTFRHYLEQLQTGASGLIGEDEISPVSTLERLDDLSAYAERGRGALDQVAVIKLNGGLGTSMGMTRAKSLLEVKPGLRFLDLIAQQVLALRERTQARVPLLCMNSFRTRDDSLAVLAGYSVELPGIPLDFLQHKIPRIDAVHGGPVAWEREPVHEWCPPGHGDLYPALVTSGALAALREAGIRYAFVSNADNLGATLDERVLGWVAEEGIPFAMEVTDRTRADRKGGHLAVRRSDGALVLRESAQCAEADRDSFQDIERHRFFNTNNLWIDLDALQAALDDRGGVLGLPMIRNEKRCDPLDPASPQTIQLETAMGAAIEAFAGARALAVSRDRFAPVKTTNDLLAVMSDAYTLTEDRRVVRHQDTAGDLVVELDERFYKRVDEFLSRFPDGAPSLRACRSLRVEGDHVFGAGVVVEGAVALSSAGAEQVDVPAGRRFAG